MKRKPHFFGNGVFALCCNRDDIHAHYITPCGSDANGDPIILNLTKVVVKPMTTLPTPTALTVSVTESLLATYTSKYTGTENKYYFCVPDSDNELLLKAVNQDGNETPVIWESSSTKVLDFADKTVTLTVGIAAADDAAVTVSPADSTPQGVWLIDENSDIVQKEVNLIPGDDAVGGWVIVDTEEYGLVALLSVGMSQVSSVNFEDIVKVGQTVKKGDMLGYFLFGGSDFVMIFPKDAGFEIPAPTERSGGEYDHMLMGEEYGRFTAVA